MPTVSTITSKKLVAPVSRQRHGYFFARQCADSEGWNSGSICKRLVVDGCKTRHQAEIICIYDALVVVRIVAEGNFVSILRLIIGRLGKADRERINKI